MHRLRRAGAAGATCLRGTWGYHGDHEPHGDRLLQLRRRVPVVTVAVDTPASVARWAPIVEDVTARTGLVTSEVVPTPPYPWRWPPTRRPAPRCRSSAGLAPCRTARSPRTGCPSPW